jgi:hypothetical protein
LRIRGKAKRQLILLGTVGALLLYPYETAVAPSWRVRVTDEERNPIKRVAVTEYWSHMSIESEEHQAESVTDDGGYVAFPARSIRASLIRRGIGSLINRLNVHGADLGPHAYLIVSGDMNSTTDNSDYRPGKPLPEEIVRRRLK